MPVILNLGDNSPSKWTRYIVLWLSSANYATRLKAPIQQKKTCGAINWRQWQSEKPRAEGAELIFYLLALLQFIIILLYYLPIREVDELDRTSHQVMAGIKYT